MQSRGSNGSGSLASVVVVVTGASCTGKTTLIGRLLAGELPALAAALDVEVKDFTRVLHGAEWTDNAGSNTPNLLIHYDLTARTPFAGHGELHESAVAALSAAERVILLTVWERPEELDRRLRGRFTERGGLPFTIIRSLARGKPRRAWRSLQRFNQRRQLFRRPDDLWMLYQRWFRSCAQVPHGQHWVVQSTQPTVPTKLTALPTKPFWS